MEKVKVFELKMHGSKLIEVHKSNILGTIEAELENLENGEFDVINIQIRYKEMTVKEYENLPEFEGF